MSDSRRTTVPSSPELLDAAAEQAARLGVSRSNVLAGWLELGFRAARQDALSAAYDDFYADGDPDPVPAQVRRARAAGYDQRWP